VAARRRSPGTARGGEGIQALRSARARLITALASFAFAALVAAYTLSLGGRFLPVNEVVEPAGLIVLVAGVILRFPSLIPWSMALVASGYVVSRADHGVVDGRAAFVGTALLLAAELAAWSIGHDARIHEERDVLVRRIGGLAGLAAGSLLLGIFVVASAGFSGKAGLLAAVLGVAAAVAAVALVLRLVRSV
jgi:hypothetical protein